MNKTFRVIKNSRALIGAALVTVTAAANAAVPAAATTAITDAGADMLTAITAVIVAMVAVWGLKKLGSKMGWM